MQSEHAHLNTNYGIESQPRVSGDAHIKKVALAALANVPGAKEIIEKTFDKSAWKMPFTLPGKRYINQAMHLGF